MPNAYLDKLSQETGISRDEIEHKYERAKEIASKAGFTEGDDKFYAYTIGILKRMVGKSNESIAAQLIRTLKLIT